MQTVFIDDVMFLNKLLSMCACCSHFNQFAKRQLFQHTKESLLALKLDPKKRQVKPLGGKYGRVSVSSNLKY